MKIIYIDMDGVLADFQTAANQAPEYMIKKYGAVDEIPHIFRDLPVIEGAESAVNILAKKYDLFIATSASWGNISCSSDKRKWIEEHFGDMFRKKMFITHRKDLLIGDYLIDDRLANGAKDFMGEHIHFGWDYKKLKWNEFHDWGKVLRYLM